MDLSTVFFSNILKFLRVEFLDEKITILIIGNRLNLRHERSCIDIRNIKVYTGVPSENTKPNKKKENRKYQEGNQDSFKDFHTKYIRNYITPSRIICGLFAYLRASSRLISQNFTQSIRSCSSNCIHSARPVCMTEGS